VGDDNKDLHDVGEHDRLSERLQDGTSRASIGRIRIRHAQATAHPTSASPHPPSSALVTRPEQGHGIREFPAAIDYAARLVAWFE
jgi:hypothetical protein